MMALAVLLGFAALIGVGFAIQRIIYGPGSAPVLDVIGFLVDVLSMLS